MMWARTMSMMASRSRRMTRWRSYVHRWMIWIVGLRLREAVILNFLTSTKCQKNATGSLKTRLRIQKSTQPDYQHQYHPQHPGLTTSPQLTISEAKFLIRLIPCRHNRLNLYITIRPLWPRGILRILDRGHSMM